MPLQPLRLVGPRNGVSSGQVVVSRVATREWRVTIGALKSENGAELKGEAVRIRYAVQEEGPYCDTLVEKAPAGQNVVPVWLIVDIPRDQEPGLYTGELTMWAGPRQLRVPVELQVCAWTLPDPKDYISHVSLLHSPDTLALKYDVEPWSDRHFELIERSLALMGQVGNDVIYIPVVRLTHLGNNNVMIRWTKAAGGFDVDFAVFDRFLDLYEKHCGPPKVLCLEVWNHRIRGGDPPPYRGAEGSEAFWSPMMAGVRESVGRRGWDESCIMIGAAGDRWPGKPTVEFFKQIAPYARWCIYTHGRWRGTRKDGEDGRLTAFSGMEIGYYVNPWGYGETRLVGDTRYKPWTKPFVHAGSMRECISAWSHPVRYRNLADISINKGNQGFGRIGLDYWPIEGQPLLCKYERKGWERLYKENPRSVVVSGEHGAAPTVRFQLLREGVQEAEARIVIAAALARDDAGDVLGEDLFRLCSDLLAERRAVRAEAKDRAQAQVESDWLQLTARLFQAAADVASTLGGGQH